MSEMTYFITGATGYIGERLALKLAGDGHMVHALIRLPERARKLSHPNIQLFEGDILEISTIEKAIKDCDFAFHLAAYAKVWSKDKELPYKINVQGTANIFDMSLKHQLRRVVFTSTGGTLEPSDGIHTTSEDTPRKIHYFNPYEQTKAKAEKLALDYVAKGLDIVIVNPTRVYGPGLISESNAMTKIIKQFNDGRWRVIPGDGTKMGNYVYVDDVVKGHLQAMARGKSGERYIIGGENISYDRFFRKLRAITGRNQRLFHIPYRIMFFAGSAQFWFAHLTGKAPLITPQWLRKYLHHWAVSVEKAEDELGFKVTTLDEGLRKTVDWLNQNNK
jgi:farnesol dehydrogenase